MIIGVGTDIVEIERVNRVLTRHPDTFPQRVFTEAECSLAAQREGKLEFYAGRWAAKEATVKALGCGIGPDCGFLDIEITNDERGKPVASLAGAGARTMARLGVANLHVSISHDTNYACAFAVAEGE